jgi:hypothetical protein
MLTLLHSLLLLSLLTLAHTARPPEPFCIAMPTIEQIPLSLG